MVASRNVSCWSIHIQLPALIGRKSFHRTTLASFRRCLLFLSTTCWCLFFFIETHSYGVSLRMKTAAHSSHHPPTPRPSSRLLDSRRRPSCSDTPMDRTRTSLHLQRLQEPASTHNTVLLYASAIGQPSLSTLFQLISATRSCTHGTW